MEKDVTRTKKSSARSSSLYRRHEERLVVQFPSCYYSILPSPIPTGDGNRVHQIRKGRGINGAPKQRECGIPPITHSRKSCFPLFCHLHSLEAGPILFDGCCFVPGGKDLSQTPFFRFSIHPTSMHRKADPLYARTRPVETKSPGSVAHRYRSELERLTPEGLIPNRQQLSIPLDGFLHLATLGKSPESGNLYSCQPPVVGDG